MSTWMRCLVMYSLAALCLAVVAVPASAAVESPCPDPDNLLVNCGFDTDTSSWVASFNSVISHEPTDGVTAPGSLVARFLGIPGQANWSVDSECVALGANETYVFGMWARHNGTGDAPDNCRAVLIRWADSSDCSGNSVFVSGSSKSGLSFAQVNGSITTDAPGEFVKVRINCLRGEAGVTEVHMDDAYIGLQGSVARITFTIGVMVNGLAGSGLVLQNNGGDDLAIAADGSFTFTTPITDGLTYNVTVQTQPGSPQQICSVTNGSGTLIGANVTNVTIDCTDAFTIGGTVSGLAGSGLVLQNNRGDDLAIAADGSFTFATPIADGLTYSVTVQNQPVSLNQICTVSNDSGTVMSANVTTVMIVCTNTYTVGGMVSGLAGSGLVLQNNDGDDLAINSNGSFTFATALVDGAFYRVTVQIQPSDLSQTCSVTNNSGEGNVKGANFTSVMINCITNTYTIGGAISGLAGSGLVLQNNGGDDLALSANGSFTFATALTDGVFYNVTVQTRPSGPNQYCSVTSDSGTLMGANVTSVSIDCDLAMVWNESGDARSFPDGAAQVTVGDGFLVTITGSTGVGDLRDAYCIKIIDPLDFVATTDPMTEAGASADFNTRLFLFRPDGAPLLANDDTPPTESPFLSTLTGMATDGSGFVVTQDRKYVLIIGGHPDEPKDSTSAVIFELGSNPEFVVAPNPAAGGFDGWQDVGETGNYSIELGGVRLCQNKLDAIFANDNSSNRACFNDGSGSFSCSDVEDESAFTTGVALGFVDLDGDLDAVIANVSEVDNENRVCLGDGRGGFSCSDGGGTGNSYSVALGFVDGDDKLDAVFANVLKNRVCLGDGSGGFSCSDVSADTSESVAVALGFLDSDGNLDAVFANPGQNRVCLGDGGGGFSCSDAGGTGNSYSVALGFLDGDGDLDAVFADQGQNRVCLGDGSGGLSCSDAGGAGNSYSVALGFVDGDDDLDAVFAKDGSNSVCLGDGSGGFSCSNVTADTRDSRGVALGDVDGNGVLDAVFANYTGTPRENRLCLGDGNGSFSCSDLSIDTNFTLGVALGELGTILIFSDGFEGSDE